jgi:hypothetical protein
VASSLSFVCQLYQHELCQGFRCRSDKVPGPVLPFYASNLDDLVHLGIGIRAEKNAAPVLNLERENLP